MPLLHVVLKYTHSTTSYDLVDLLGGSIPRQPIQLVAYSTEKGSASATNHIIYVKVDWFNNFDVNTNLVGGAIPLIITASSSAVIHNVELCNYELNPAKTINHNFKYEFFQENGDKWSGRDMTVHLMFNYRRDQLI